jgi:hypothetical protein
VHGHDHGADHVDIIGHDHVYALDDNETIQRSDLLRRATSSLTTRTSRLPGPWADDARGRGAGPRALPGDPPEARARRRSTRAVLIR